MKSAAGRFRVYPAAHGDLEVIADLAGRSDDWVRYAAKRGRRDDVWIWAARFDGRLAGLVDLDAAWIGRGTAGSSRLKRIVLGQDLHQPDSILEPHQYGRIRDLVIVDDAHYCGAGTALVNQCMRQMQQAAVTEIQIELHSKDSAAQDLCRRLGFGTERYLLTAAIPEETLPAEADIRPAEMNDLPQLSEMVRQEIAAQLQPARSPRLRASVDWEQYVGEKLQAPNITILVCEKNGRLAGYLEIRLFALGQESLGKTLRALAGRRRQELHSTAATALVEDIFVRESSRRQGVALRLLRQAERWCREMGVKETRAQVWANNQASLALFHGMGYELARVQFSRVV